MKTLSKKTVTAVSTKKIKKNKAQISSNYIRYIILPSIILVSVLTAKLIIKTYTQPMVLGTSTYLHTEGNTFGDGYPSTGNKNDQNSTAIDAPIENSNQIDCIGPDNKHFQTTYQNCKDLNASWHHRNFSFTPLSKQQETYFETPNVSEKAKISTSSANMFIIRKADTETQTELPVKMSSQSGKLTISTATGTIQLMIEPDEAVASLLQNKILTTVETKSSDTKESSSSALINKTITKSMNLTMFNNQPVFSINGLSDKKLLGIIPVQFAKTVYVSTETGQIVNTDETPLAKFLETFSF